MDDEVAGREMGKDRANATDSGHAEFEISLGDFLGDTVVKTLCFHCRGQGFNPWFGN